MEGVIKFENRQEVLDTISSKMDKSDGWVFISKKSLNKKSVATIMSPDRDHILACIMIVIKQEPEWWDILKKNIDKSDDK